MQEIYRFRPFTITKVQPEGNIRLGTMCPKQRSGHRIVADNGNIYSFGGYNPNLDRPEADSDDFIWIDRCLLFKELWKFNIATKTWTKLKTSGAMPEQLVSHAATLLGDHLLVFGGTGVPFGMVSSNSVHLCNLKTLQWMEIETTGEKPLPQYGQAIAVHKNKLYTIGGTTGFEYSINVHCLDLETQQWSELLANPEPAGRYRHELSFEDGKLFVFGGGTATNSFGMKKVPIFDIKDQEWKTELTSKENPGARRCHGCVQMDSDIYISGGQNNGSILSDIWMMNLKSMQWTQLSCQLPNPVYFHSATATPEGQMFIFGGVTNIELNTRSNDVYSMWTKIPSLKEICWQSVLHYIPHIGEVNKAKLLATGIPLHFLERVDFFKEGKLSQLQ